MQVAEKVGIAGFILWWIPFWIVGFDAYAWHQIVTHKLLITCLAIWQPFAWWTFANSWRGKRSDRLAGILKYLRLAPFWMRGRAASRQLTPPPAAGRGCSNNWLRQYFDSLSSGPGMWKWEHYFDVYERHLAKFAGTAVHIAEVGVLSGGSLTMWRRYFGEHSTIHGIDIAAECQQFQAERIDIHIGDQGDRNFWKRFRVQVPILHVLIDDGSHIARHQIVTLEEIFSHLQPGGVYICEDVTGDGNRFSGYIDGLKHTLNAFNLTAPSEVSPNSTQQAIASIHYYPYMVVIEKHVQAPKLLCAPRHGSDWISIPGIVVDPVEVAPLADSAARATIDRYQVPHSRSH